VNVGCRVPCTNSFVHVFQPGTMHRLRSIPDGRCPDKPGPKDHGQTSLSMPPHSPDQGGRSRVEPAPPIPRPGPEPRLRQRRGLWSTCDTDNSTSASQSGFLGIVRQVARHALIHSDKPARGEAAGVRWRGRPIRKRRASLRRKTNRRRKSNPMRTRLVSPELAFFAGIGESFARKRYTIANCGDLGQSDLFFLVARVRPDHNDCERNARGDVATSGSPAG
jgi:hypothetical protein